MKSTITWILIADGAQAKIFAHGGPGSGLTAVPEMMEENAHLSNKDIMADKPGRTFASAGTGRSAYEPATDPLQAREAGFMKAAAARLDQKLQEGAYSRLIIAAAPTALGDLRQALSKPVQDTIIAELSKDLTNIPTDKLARHFDGVLAT